MAVFETHDDILNQWSKFFDEHGVALKVLKNRFKLTPLAWTSKNKNGVVKVFVNVNRIPQLSPPLSGDHYLIATLAHEYGHAVKALTHDSYFPIMAANMSRNSVYLVESIYQDRLSADLKVNPKDIIGVFYGDN